MGAFLRIRLGTVIAC